MKLRVIILFSISLFLFSCKKEKAQQPTSEPGTPELVKFAAQVQPIFQQNCGTGGGCHGAGPGGNSDGKIYETHAGAAAVDNAETIGAIKHTAGFEQMPQGGTQLSSEKIEIIEAWINGGKKND